MGVPNISQVVLIFQKNKFQVIHKLQLLHGTLVLGRRGGPVPMQDGSPQLQDMDPTPCRGLGMYCCVPIVPIRYEYLSTEMNIAQDLFHGMNNHNSSNNT